MKECTCFGRSAHGCSVVSHGCSVVSHRCSVVHACSAILPIFANGIIHNSLTLHLTKLSLINFKNYAQQDVEFSARINCIMGSNGSGKTNLLDAIHYLSFCKSFFNPVDGQNILHDAPFMVIQGIYDAEGAEEKIYCGLKRNQKKQFKRNQLEYARLSDHIGLFPLVMVSPSDVDLIMEGSDCRRRFIDSVICQFNKKYLDTLVYYNKILFQRNATLRGFSERGVFDRDALEVWDVQMVDSGEKIHGWRKSFISDFIPTFKRHYEYISGAKETVDILYDSQLNEAGFGMKLKEAVEKDRAFQYSTVGIHRDDLTFNIGNYPIKKFGSQGQQKSFLLALKLAEFDFISNIKGLPPLLLLDDIFDKLDETRVKRLMELVSSEKFGQIFITDTHPDRIAGMFQQDAPEVKRFKVENGNIN